MESENDPLFRVTFAPFNIVPLESRTIPSTVTFAHAIEGAAQKRKQSRHFSMDRDRGMT
jgi:hypothetical protein